MMNKQEAIEKIKNISAVETFMSEIIWVKRDEVLDIINQLNEPEKPIVPQFVADWYEDNEDGFEFNLYALCLDFNNCEVDKELSDWFCDKHNKPIETLVKMKLYGYKVEKDEEKRYYVELPSSNKQGRLVLVKDNDGDIVYDCYFSDKWKKHDYTKLTEKEIKKDHAWAWQFAEEVEER